MELPKWLVNKIAAAEKKVRENPPVVRGKFNHVEVVPGIHCFEHGLCLSGTTLARLQSEFVSQNFPDAPPRLVKFYSSRSSRKARAWIPINLIKENLADIREAIEKRGIFPDEMKARAAKAGISITHFFSHDSRARYSTMLLAGPDDEEREKRGMQLVGLDKTRKWDITSRLKGKLGHVTVGHVILRNKSFDKGEPALLVTTIHQRKAFYELGNRAKKDFDRWYDGVLDVIEGIAKRNGIRKVAIISAVEAKERAREWVHISDSVLDQFYERFPQRRGYRKKKLLTQAHLVYGPDRRVIWVKNIR